MASDAPGSNRRHESPAMGPGWGPGWGGPAKGEAGSSGSAVHLGQACPTRNTWLRRPPSPKRIAERKRPHCRARRAEGADDRGLLEGLALNPGKTDMRVRIIAADKGARQACGKAGDAD